MSIKIPYSNTTIAPERTKADIEKMLKENEIQDIQWTTLNGETTLRFLWRIELKGVQKAIMFQFKPPIIPSKKRTWTGMRYETITVNLEATAYRLLWHYLKNKLQAVKWGLESMEREFLSHAVISLPSGQTATVGERINEIMERFETPQLTEKIDEKKIIDIEAVDTEKVSE